MNLAYNILWFEDDQDWYESIIDNIKEIIEDELGFIMTMPLLKKNGDDIDSINFSEYDIILMDLNLEKSPTGDKLIEKIRGFEVFTNIIFYSSEGISKVSEKVKNLELEGVYFSSRDGNSFIKKVEKIIHTTIKKVQDINNMRGLILAETSDLDKKMHKIVETVLQNREDFKDALTTHLFDEAIKYSSEKKKKCDKYSSDSDTTKLLKESMLFDTERKIYATQFILDSILPDSFSIHKQNGFKNSYKERISKPRNILAHGIPINKDGKKIFVYKSTEIELTDEYCSEIRKALKLYGDLLDSINKNISTPAHSLQLTTFK